MKVNFESGVISLPSGQANATTWQTAAFARNFNSLVPVVVMGPAYSADGEPHAVRVRNVTATGFQWQIDEWDYLTGAHTGAITVHFFAMTQGTHVFGSQRWQVGRVTGVNRANTTVPLTGFTAAPMVLTQVESTANLIATDNPRALKTRNSAVTSTGFVVNLETQLSYTTAISNENIGYIAVSEGIGYLDGKVLWSYSPGTVSNSIKTFYTGPFTNPVVVAQTQTKNDTEPGDLRMASLPILSNGSTRVQLTFQEETSGNTNLSHTAETVAGVFVGDMPGESAAKLVFGSVTVNQTSATAWFKVNLASAYTNPVVVFGPLTRNEATPAGIRVRNVLAVDAANGNKASFEYQLDEWDFADGIHPAETATYMVMEAGVYAIGGQVVQAGAKTGVTNTASVQYLSDTYWAGDIYYEREPAVFAQCVTVNEASAVTARVDAVDTLYDWPVNFRVRLTEAENADQTHAGETVHYIVMPGGTGQFMSTNSNFRFNTGVANNLSSSAAYNSFGTNRYAGPIAFASAQGTLDATFAVDGYYETAIAADLQPILLRRIGLNAQGINWIADEDFSPSADNSHTAEVGAWLVVQQQADADGDGVTDALETQMGTNINLATSTTNASGGVASDWDTLQSLYSLTATVTAASAYEKVDKTASTPVASPARISLVRTSGTMPLTLKVTLENGTTDITKANAVPADYSITGLTGGNLVLTAGQAVPATPYVLNIDPVQDSNVEVPESLKVSVGAVPSGANPPVVNYANTVRICDADPANTNNRTMYVAYLSRGPGVVSTGSGVAVAQLEGDNDNAKVSVNVSGLSSPQNTTYLRINNDQDIRNNLGVGVVTNQTWLIRAAASETTDQAMLQALRDGRIYVDINTVNYTAGEILGYFNEAQGDDDFDPDRPDLDEPALPGSLTATQAERDMYRFLDQSTFGASTTAYNELKAIVDLVDPISDGITSANLIQGYSNWIDKQMDLGQTPSPNFLTLVMAADNEEFMMRGAKPIQAGNDPQFAGSGFAATYDGFGNITNPYQAATNNAYSFNSPQSSANRRREWWTMVLQSKDQLRQRMAAALSEILVISENDTNVGARHYGAANYWDMMAQGAFGKYRDLLEKVTYSPMMGIYLSHLRNRSRYVSGGVEIFPDENYAREIMQLFTIGLVLRHPDGGLILDSGTGLPIPTYDQIDITELARVLTGLTYGARHSTVTVKRTGQGGALVNSNVQAGPQIEVQGVNYTDFTGSAGESFYQAPWIYPMKGIGRFNGINYHDFSPYVDPVTSAVSSTVSKVLFRNKAGQTDIPIQDISGLNDTETNPLVDTDIRLAHNALAGDPASGTYNGHPNTPVFISRLLIQRFVTSNPSPGYLYRVSEVYRSSNGNLGQVLKTILLDYEARALAIPDSLPGSGKLKEPLVQYASMLRGLSARSNAPLTSLANMSLPFSGADSPSTTPYPSAEVAKFPVGASRIRFNDLTGAIGQSPQKAPSVFNWYLPDYVQPGAMAAAGLFGPELQINTESMLVNRVNRHYAINLMNLGGGFPGFGVDDFVTNSANMASELLTDVATLTFTPANWNTPQTVTVRGLDNFDGDGTRSTSIIHTLASSDPNYASVYTPPINFTVTDNDTLNAKLVAVYQSGNSTTVTEGQPGDTYTVVLTAPPASGQTVTVTPGAVQPWQTLAAPVANTDVTISPATLTFNTTNWNTPQTVTVTAVDDAIANTFLVGAAPLTSRLAVIRNIITSGDTDYNGMVVSDFNCPVNDNDTGRRFVLTKPSSTTGLAAVIENSTTDSFQLNFATSTAPTANVVVTINYDPTRIDLTSTDANFAKPSSGVATQTFNASNYASARSINIVAVNDTTYQGLQFSAITFAVTSTDTAYNGLGTMPLHVRVTDNDSATINGISVLPTWGNNRVMEGGMTDQYYVVLNKEPTGNVTLTWTGNNADVSGIGNLTFTTANWWNPQVVTVSATDDFSVETPRVSPVKYTASGGGYTDVTTFDVSVGDNDQNSSAGFIVTQSGGTTAVTEGGATDSYDIKLTGAPSGNVAVALAVNPATQLTLSATSMVNGSLIFTPSNWNTVQTVTVTATNDTIAEANGNATIVSTVTSTDSKFNNFVIGDINVAVTDNDTGSRIVLAPTGGTTEVTEGGATDTVNVSFTGGAAPASNVTITLTANAQLSLSPTTLTFTPANYTTPQAVTVTAANDTATEAYVESVITAATDAVQPAGYTTLNATTTAVVYDNDDINNNGAIQIVQTNTNTRVIENGMTDTFEVALRRRPLANVTLTPTFSSAGQVTLSTSTLTFTPTNWFIPQTVTVTAVDDAALENYHTTTLTYTASNTGGYVPLDTTAFTIGIGDNDSTYAGVTVSATAGSVTEGGATFSYNVIFSVAPSAGATIRVTPTAYFNNAANSGQVTFSPTSMDFTNATSGTTQWNRTATFTVTAVDSTVAEAAMDLVIMNTVATIGGTDNRYNSTPAPDVTLTVNDNDTGVGRIVIAQSGGATVVPEDVGTDTVDISLAGPVPAANVTVNLARAGSQFRFLINGSPVDSTSLTFTPANYTTPQTLTLIAAADTGSEGIHTDTLNATTASTAPANWTSLLTSQLIRVLDSDDLARALIALTHSGGTTRILEGGATDTYTVSLRRAPTANVTLTPVYNSTQFTLSPVNLTFTPSNWNKPQTVTVTAIDDAEVENYHTATGTYYASNTGGYLQSDTISTGNIAIGDNDVAGTALVNITESGGYTMLAEGGVNTDTYTVVLGAAPSSNVVLTPFGSNSAGGVNQVSFSPATLTFTNANWSTPQTVTVTLTPNTANSGHRAVFIGHSVATTDAAYKAYAIPAVNAMVTDANDGTVGIGVIPTNGTTTVYEGTPGNSDTVYVYLRKAPTANVTVTPTLNLPGPPLSLLSGQVTFSPATLTFTTTNWNVPQLLTITAVNDAVVDTPSLNTTLLLTPSATGGYAAGNTITLTNVMLNDNDASGSLLITQNGTNVQEGGTATYTIKLTSAPTQQVTVTIVTQKHARPSSSHAVQYGYFANAATTSNLQKDNIQFDWTELSGIYTAAYHAARGATAETTANAPAGHLAGTKAVIDKLDLLWAGGRMKTLWPDGASATDNQRVVIIDGVHNSYSLTRLSTDTTNFPNEVRDRCRFAAYLVSIAPAAITSH